MSPSPGAKRATFKQARDPNGWYQEPQWCRAQLFVTVRFIGPIHDPACGEGRIVKAAREAGYAATGPDIVDRGFGEVWVDFLTDDRPRTTLVFNAPYKLNEASIAHGFKVTTEAMAMIVRVPRLCGQKRFWDLYQPCPPTYVLMCSQRPSMPPRGRGMKEKVGTPDYCRLIWTRRPLERQRDGGLAESGWG